MFKNENALYRVTLYAWESEVKNSVSPAWLVMRLSYFPPARIKILGCGFAAAAPHPLASVYIEVDATARRIVLPLALYL